MCECMCIICSAASAKYITFALGRFQSFVYASFIHTCECTYSYMDMGNEWSSESLNDFSHTYALYRIHINTINVQFATTTHSPNRSSNNTCIYCGNYNAKWNIAVRKKNTSSEHKSISRHVLFSYLFHVSKTHSLKCFGC